MSDLHAAGVDHQGLMKVLADNLYSEPEVALRELVQNAHDSITRRRLESTEPFDARIEVTFQAPSTLRIRDSGAGLLRDEIVRYLATIGGGYTRVLRAQHGDHSLVGAFGLGFLSAYVVADQVEVNTVSHTDPARGHRFRSRDGIRFSIDAIAGGEPGTEVVLQLNKASEVLRSAQGIRSLLTRYCRMLDVPIHAPDRINIGDRPWRAPPDQRPPATHQALWNGCAAHFEGRFDVLAALPLEPIPGTEVTGLVWLHDGASWATSDHRGVSAFVRGMLVTEEATQLLPEWAGFAGAMIDATHLVPTASREDLKRDATWTKVREGLRHSLVSALKTIATQIPHAWRRITARHNDALFGAALSEPELFDLLADELKLVTSEGTMTLPEVAARSGNRIALSVGDDSGYEQLLHRALGKPVVDATRFGAAALASRWAASRGFPVATLGTSEGDAATFPETVVDRALLARLRDVFALEDTRVVPSRFQPGLVPLVLVPDRAAQLKQRIEDDRADGRLSAGLLGLARGFTQQIAATEPMTLYLNLDNPLVQRIAEAPPERARPAAAILIAAADLTARRSADDFGRDLPDALQALTDSVSALLE